MLRVRITNETERKQLEHGRGRLEFGRGPQRDNVPRCVIKDVYVSKDHVSVERLPNGLVRVENLSQKHPILLPGNLVIPPTEKRDLAPPVQFTVGYTTIELEPAREEALDRDQLGTIAQSLWRAGTKTPRWRWPAASVGRRTPRWRSAWPSGSRR